MKKIAVGILAHVDSGKTTLSEALMYSSGNITKLGRVDHRDSFLDTFSLERDRGITIFSKQAAMKYNNTEFTLLDTPGHVDFSAEAERTLQVLDYAILVISGTDGVQSHTCTLWKLLKKYNVPCFIFVNKMDLDGADKLSVMAQLRTGLDENCVDFTYPNSDGFRESVAVCDEKILEKYYETIQEEAAKGNQKYIDVMVAQHDMSKASENYDGKVLGADDIASMSLDDIRDLGREASQSLIDTDNQINEIKKNKLYNEK